METFEKTFKLPSSGYFGGPKEVTLRAMTTKEEKLLYTSRDLTFLDRLIKSCCVEPKDLDTGLLHQNDIMYLTFALRELTFGSTYLQEVICPICGHKQQVEIDITEMEIKNLDTDGIEQKLNVKLPVNGDTLQLKLLSSGDIRRIDRVVKQKTAKGRLKNPDEYELLLKMAELVTVENRTAGKIVYQIPDRHIRRELAPRQVIRVPKEEIEALSYTAGGLDLIRNHLLVKDEQVLDDLNIHREPEYYMNADNVAKLIKEGTLNEFKDALDFAPDGVKDMIKDLSVQIPLNDFSKRQALKEMTGFDVDAAIQHDQENKAIEGNDAPAAPAPKVRRVQATPGRRASNGVATQAAAASKTRIIKK